MKPLLLVVIGAAAFAQTAPRVERDIAQAEPKNERQLLDVFAPATGIFLMGHSCGRPTGRLALYR